MSARLPIAAQGVFHTIQGEGALLGVPMVFIRLAGCSVGCETCDTDYSVAERLTVNEVVVRAVEACTPATEWVWITGGEPTDHDLKPLILALRRNRFRIALATSGVRFVERGSFAGWPNYEPSCPIDFISVSPHSADGWVQRAGDQVNLVPGLNGLRLADVEAIADECGARFTYCYVTPCDGKPETLDVCLEWVRRKPGWRLGCQSHKNWGLR